MTRAFWRWVLKACAIVLILLAVLYVRLVFESRRDLLRGEQALKESRMQDAVYFMRSSALAYAPFNPFVGKAHERLWQIGRKAEIMGQGDLALESYRAIRSSILAVRSFYTPGEEMLGLANARLSALMARSPHPADFSGKSKEELRRLHMALLSETRQPSPAWSLILLAGFFLWTGSIIYFIFSGLSDSLAIVRGPAFRSLAGFCGGVALWIGGMFMA